MRKFVFIAVFLFLILPAVNVVNAQDIYVAQNSGGAGNGADCADALSLSWFNNSSNWGSGPSEIGPGTTVHLCGTFTQSGSTAEFIVQGSGTSGNPIWLKTEPGFVCQSVQFPASIGSGTGGCFQVDGYNYIKIGGATACGTTTGAVDSSNTCDGVIENTAYGTTSAYPYASGNGSGASIGIIISGCTGCEVSDIQLGPFYVNNGVWSVNSISCTSGGVCAITCPSTCLGQSGSNPNSSASPIGVGQLTAISGVSGFSNSATLTVAASPAPTLSTYTVTGGTASFSGTGLSGLAYDESIGPINTSVDCLHVSSPVNFSFHDSKCHDGGWLFGWSGTLPAGSTNLSVYNNQFYAMDHGVYGGPSDNVTGSGPVFIYANHFHDMVYWDDSPGLDHNHHDDIHLQEDVSLGKGNTSPPSQEFFAGVYIYGNRHDGDPGGANTHFFLRASANGEYVFNNILGCVPYRGFHDPFEAGTGDTAYNGRHSDNIYYLNNTWKCATTGSAISADGGVAMGWPDTQYSAGSWNFENNIVQGQKVLTNPAGTASTYFGLYDYNIYQDLWRDCPSGCSGQWLFSWASHNTVCLTPTLCSSGFSESKNNPSGSYSWQTVVGSNNETHSLIKQTAAVKLNPNGSPQTGSPALNAGVNLTSLCTGSLTPLCTDIAGNARPSSGAWTIGAYQGAGSVSSNQPAPPTGLTATVQ